MMVLFAGGAFPSRQEVIFAVALFSVFMSLSVRHRRSAGWHWQGVNTRNLFIAAAGVIYLSLFG
jgi:hypothetical protein